MNNILEIRGLNWGVARNHDYDAIITGSSMAMNHYPEVADSLWGWKTKNFSIMGATDDDYAVILPFVISQRKVHNIILGIDFFSFARRRGAINKYLYDDNVWNDYEYLWNYTSLKNAVSFLRNPLNEKNLYHFNSSIGRKQLMDDFKKNYKKGYPELDFSIEEMMRRFDESVLCTIANNGDNIRWYVYFPPYSIGEFIIYDIHDDLDSILKFKQYIITKLLNLNNVMLFDFQQSPWIDNLNEYMDLRHHSHEYNKEILRKIYDGKFQSEKDGNVSNIRSLVKQYRDSFSVVSR